MEEREEMFSTFAIALIKMMSLLSLSCFVKIETYMFVTLKLLKCVLY